MGCYCVFITADRSLDTLDRYPIGRGTVALTSYLLWDQLMVVTCTIARERKREREREKQIVLRDKHTEAQTHSDLELGVQQEHKGPFL